jgi:hypothetical protein
MVYLIEPPLKIDFKQRFVSYSAPRQDYKRFPKSCVSITMGAICKNYFYASDRHTIERLTRWPGPDAIAQPRLWLRSSGSGFHSKDTYFFAQITLISNSCKFETDERGAGITVFDCLPPPTMPSQVSWQATASTSSPSLLTTRPWCSSFHVLHSYYPPGSLKAIMKVPFRFWKLMRTFVD